MLPFITLVAFDVETTGLEPDREDIVELAGVKFTLERKDGKLVCREVAQFQSLAKPTKLIPDEAMRVHKITNQMVEDAPELKNVLQGFFRFCGLSSVLVAHNAAFDTAFVAKGVRKHGLVMPQNPVVDSLKFVRKLLPEYASHRLGEVARKLGDQTALSLNQADLHRATYDCIVLMEVFAACLRKRYQDKDLLMDCALKSLESLHGPSLRFEQFA
jgi:DNA polymerase III epsilon subunit family exonuclease